jgi:hypothetical protein
MSDNPYEAQIRALLSGGAPAPTKMVDNAQTQWAAQRTHDEIAANRQLLTSRTLAARERNAAARTARISEQERRLAAQEREQAAALKEQVRAQLQAAWPGNRSDFNAAFPQLYENFLLEKTLKNAARIRSTSPAYGAI